MAEEEARWEKIRTEGVTLCDHNGKAIGVLLPATSDEDPFAADFIRDPFYNDPEAKQ